MCQGLLAACRWQLVVLRGLCGLPDSDARASGTCSAGRRRSGWRCAADLTVTLTVRLALAPLGSLLALPSFGLFDLTLVPCRLRAFAAFFLSDVTRELAPG